MKLNNMSAINCSLSMVGILLALAGSEGYAGTMGPAAVGAPGKIYIGVFGGAGASSEFDISQYGTAYYTEAAGGPLAVNAFGTTNSRTVGIVGAQVGYQWAEILSNPFNAQWGLVPAFELEGYYLSKSSFTSHDINNDTTRLVEHDFLVTYPMSAGVFLANALLNINPAESRFHPYVGAGIGAAVVSISDATAIQVAPAEPGLNHYNSNPSETVSTFAGQAKAGLSFDLTQNASIFVEYRYLYLANTSYEFGSTVFPAHPVTSAWRVRMDSQDYNMGSVGLKYTI